MAKNANQTYLVALDDSAAQEKLNTLTQKRVVELELQFSGDFDKHTQEIEKRLGNISRQLDSMRSGMSSLGKESKSASGGLLNTATTYIGTASSIASIYHLIKDTTTAQASFG
ncbi:hypothetical protein [Hominifimenecus sp. rT4P-3]|uniref:hypothetical protein n=1 Tax=Hominifimenecus sp. rT4P-3 TaxID=3242979 RepID=UPI003DA28BC3